MTKLKIGTLAVIGVGLIGGSFAAALRRAGGVDRILGAGRRPETLARAVALGLIDEAVTFKEAAARADLIFIAAPVGAFEAIFSEIAPHLGAKTIVTDGGSTKRNVIEAARSGLGQRVAQFVPGHPMAGSHETGPQAANASFSNTRLSCTQTFSCCLSVMPAYMGMLMTSLKYASACGQCPRLKPLAA